MTTIKISAAALNINGSSKLSIDDEEIKSASYIRLEIEAGYPTKLDIHRHCFSAEESDRLQAEGWAIDEPDIESETTYIPRTARITYVMKEAKFTGEILGRF